MHLIAPQGIEIGDGIGNIAHLPHLIAPQGIEIVQRSHSKTGTGWHLIAPQGIEICISFDKKFI